MGKQVTESCAKHGGFYLGSIGGAAAVLASDNIKKVEVLDFEDQGMEAVWKIEIEDFPAFILVDDKGNDFFSKWSMLGQTGLSDLPDGTSEGDDNGSEYNYFQGLWIGSSSWTSGLSTDHCLRPCRVSEILAASMFAGAGKFIGKQSHFLYACFLSLAIRDCTGAQPPFSILPRLRSNSASLCSFAYCVERLMV